MASLSVLAAKVPLRREPGDICLVGSHAMLTGRWNLRGSGPDLTRLDIFGWQHSLVRRSLTGDWRFLVDCWSVDSSLALPPHTGRALPSAARGRSLAQEG